MKFSTFLSTLAVFALFSAKAFSTPVELKVDFGYIHVFGEDRVFNLKEMIASQHPDFQTTDVALNKIRVIAKSQYGWASASFKVGDARSNSQGIYGNPDTYENDWITTYDSHGFYNPAQNSRGDWTLIVVPNRDNVKIKEVIISLDVPWTFDCDTSRDRMIDGICVRPLPIHVFYSYDAGDHFYSHNPQNPGGSYEWKGQVWNTPITSYALDGVAPFFRLYNGSVQDHFYTADIFEADYAARNLGYRYENDTYQIFTQPKEGTVALHRFYNPSTGDHMYKLTTEPDLGYRYEKIAGYVFP